MEKNIRSSIIKYGLIAGAVVVIIPFVSELIIGSGPDSYQTAEVIGYAGIILSLLVIFLAVREYHQKYPEKPLGFGKIFSIGVGISAIAGLMFGIYNWVYVTFISPEFMQEYYAYYVESIQNSGAEPAEIESKIAELEQQKSFFMNPWISSFMMFLTVFIIGLVVSLLAGMFQRQQAQPAQV